MLEEVERVSKCFKEMRYLAHMELFKGFLREFLISRWKEDYPDTEFDEEVVFEIMDLSEDIFSESGLEEFLDAVLYVFLEDDSEEDTEDETDLEEDTDLEDDSEEDIEEDTEEEFYDDEDVEESLGQRVVRVRKGQKQRVRIKKGFKRGKDGKLKRMSMKEKKARKRAGKRIGRKRQTGSARIKQARSLRIRKARRIGEAVDLNVVSYMSKKDFAFTVNESEEFTILKGYSVLVEDVDSRSVSLQVLDKDSKLVYEGVVVESEFVNQCLESDFLESVQINGEGIDEQILRGNSVDTVVEDSVEKPTLTYNEESGFLFVSEGARYVLGNKIRTRSFLLSEGIIVSNDILERAKKEAVVLLEDME